ncbi:MAG: isoleucine--tRNA ligase [Candidatus Eremiobacteraeota bacterium]|nr:isoleucine--tRNA ligase [Candidatus Eremiobacteraeota bacterium]MBC5826765.1 isoleucine--tRNA ligase [Candidatus Eremiobacteraeota bacterium]
MKERKVEGRLFAPFPDHPDTPSRELEILDLWNRERVFERTLEQTVDGPRFTFYEGPPTANGRPGVHHVLTRTFKDLFPRFWTMRGYFVRRQGGWDTHGLPVEHEVERELGIFDKSRLEREVGVAEFNRRCRESVFRYVDEWNRLTQRMGYWIDLQGAYITLSNDYIESVWWLLKLLWDRGLVQQDYKVVPYDPRIGATLSDHEVAQGYRDVDDPSVFVRFRLRDDPRTSLLAWTTTPWTLPANMALAVHPEVDYCIVERASSERIILAEQLVGPVFREEPVAVIRRMRGADLAGMRYVSPYDYCTMQGDRHYVIPARFVTTDAGTGIVHIAPAYGADDLTLAKSNNLPVYHSVDLGGHVVENVLVAAGLFFKEADGPIMADLEARQLLFRAETYRHSYPFGWRTGDPLLYFAKTAWFIRTTAFRAQLLANNDAVNWFPESIKHGRFGDWLENNVDWALSRERFWGTPLPLWTDGKEFVCVGSLDELSTLCGRDLRGMDLHRPSIDGVTFMRDGREYRRVPEVIDAWFDSGAMPYAQWHYPFENTAHFDESFPADFICEGLDQTRGWFYSLHAIATLLFDSPAFRNAIVLGLVVDASGEKMSKSKGNVLDPYAIFETVGADALRWYFLTGSSPGVSKKISVEQIGEAARVLMGTLWNTCIFFVLYANADEVGAPPDVPLQERSDIDRWVLARLHGLISFVTGALEKYDAQNAGRAIESFIDDLSNWYVRLSRDRFWGNTPASDKAAAYRTLYECLTGVTLLIAPFVPFLAESLYQRLVRSVAADAPQSVHLARWPQARDECKDAEVIAAMSAARSVVEVGRKARALAKLKTRQPLRAAHVRPRDADAAAVQRFADLILEELNVKELNITGSDSEFIDYGLRPNLPLLGPRFGAKITAVRAALAAADSRAVAAAVSRGEPVNVSADGETFFLNPTDILVDSQSARGFVFAQGDGVLVALDTRLDGSLVLEGLAREIVRAVQEARKAAGLEVSDRIRLRIEGRGEASAAVDAWRDYIGGETLAVEINGPPFAPSFETDGEDWRIALAPADGLRRGP